MRAIFTSIKYTFEYKYIRMYVTADESGVSSNFDAQANNIVMYSSIKSLEAQLPFKNFSIKYVMEGNELYRLRGQDFIVNSGEYLLCNAYCEGKVCIESKSYVNGICIDIDSDILSEVVASYVAPDTNNPDLCLDKYFNSKDFMEQQYDSKFSKLGNHLKELDAIIKKNPHDEYQFSHEFYYKLSEGILLDYVPVVRQLQSIRSIKSETKKDLLRKLSKGKEFIDSNYLLEIDIAMVAIESNMSQYHFFRLFKDVYGVSPYQYIKQKRMQKANEIMQQTRLPLAQLAMEVGYSDIFSFSKAYKQHFGCSPTQADFSKK